MTKKRLLFCTILSCTLLALLLAFYPHDLFSQEVNTLPQAGQDNSILSPQANIKSPSMITQMAVIVGLSLAPFIVMLLTSFVKIAIVLSLLRNALGVQSAPPNQVISGIAIILSIYVMFPTGWAMYEKVQPLLKGTVPQNIVSGESAELIFDMVTVAREPLRDFLIKNTKAQHTQGFYKLAYKYFPPEFRSSLSPKDFLVLIPAFVTGQVEDAFEIGVLIYLPFFVIDLVVSNVLLAMGMMMLSPMTISLPLKLLLLVMIDGWSLLVQGLVLTFKP